MLSFVLLGGMVLALLGGILFDLPFLLGSQPPGSIAPTMWGAMFGAVIVAIYTLFKFRKKARPKDTSPSDTDSPQGPGEYWG